MSIISTHLHKNKKLLFSLLFVVAVVFAAQHGEIFAASISSTIDGTNSTGDVNSILNTPTTPNQANDIIPPVSLNIGGDAQGTNSTLQLLFLITIISLAPSLLIMMTCFTRIIIVLHFVRSALGTQQMPPNQVLVGLALFLTLFLMGPTFTTINQNALQPYSRGEITQAQAIETGMKPIREFMLKQAENKDVALFYNLDGGTYDAPEDIPNRILIPAFMLGEITKAFRIGFIIFLPFIVIDMIVSSTLMAMGMMMLPPAMISLPFKILLFTMVDGWSIIIQYTVQSFR